MKGSERVAPIVKRDFELDAHCKERDAIAQAKNVQILNDHGHLKGSVDHGERDVEEVWRAKTAFPDQLLSSPGIMACHGIQINVSFSLDLLLFLTIVNQRIQTS